MDIRGGLELIGLNTAGGIGMTSQRTRNRLVERLRNAGIQDDRVLDTIRQTPRHLFVDEALASRAYEDTALPIGQGQTISQPYIVARMTEALLAGETLDRVLEVGTGCGYQTAILAQLVGTVFSVERIASLQHQARERLYQLRHYNVRLKHSDGNWGWPENGPYDGIIVTAAPREIPEQLLQQLNPGGRLIIPIGESGHQQLVQVTQTPEGVQQQTLDMVSFVPMLQGKG